jgi:hypothetical protein
MKRLAGTPNPRSWKETKLTTYPGGGDGAAPLAGGILSLSISPFLVIDANTDQSKYISA